MTLDETVLQKVADWRPARDERQTLNVPLGRADWVLSLTADRCDELGCLLWELTLRQTTPAETRGGTFLHDWAQRVAGQVTGLVETLRVLEIDAQRDEALLRSEDPTHRHQGLFFYEVRLRGAGEATVRRYSASRAGQTREQVSYALTHEVLVKLACDLLPE